VGKEAASVVYFEVLYESVSGGTEGNHEFNEDRCCPGRSFKLPPASYFAPTLSCLFLPLCVCVDVVIVLCGLHL